MDKPEAIADLPVERGAASARAGRGSVLPFNVPRRGLSRAEAAEYVGVSASLFDIMVNDGRMPKPKRLNARTVWDRIKLDVAFDAIPDGEDEADDPWGSVAV